MKVTFGAAYKSALLLVAIGVQLAGPATTRGQSALDGFDPNANEEVYAVVVQPDGKVLIGGRFTTLSPNGGAPVTRNHIARLNPDGTLDTIFNPNAAGSFVYSIALQADGKIVVGGNFNNIGGQTRNHIARLDPTTGLADSFDPNANAFVFSIAVQGDGKILAGGAFYQRSGLPTIGGQTRNRIARLDATTGLADSFDPNASGSPNISYPAVYSIVLQTDGKILAGGNFTSIGGQTRNRIARLDATTGLADSFNPNPDPFGGVDSIAIQADGKILVGGGFTTLGGQTRNFIARLDATTGLADSFDPDANSDVLSIAVQPDGKIIAGGSFSTIGGQTRNRIARLDATTGLADSFDPNANGGVYSIAVQADGKILLGGSFSQNSGTPSIGGQTRNFIARFLAPAAAPTPTPTATPSTTPTEPHFEVSAPSVAFLGSSFNITVTAKIFDNVFTSYTGTVHFTTTSTGFGTQLPNDSTLTNGVGTFSVTLGSTGFQTITARDTVNPSMIGTSGNILVEFKPPPSPTPPPTPTATPTPTPPSEPQAINLSTRMRVGIGDDVGIGGFIITGDAPKHVLLRALGPSLAPLGVPNVLADPVMELNGPGLSSPITNDNWRDDPVQEALILATGIPPTNNFESAIDATLNPGTYTAVVKGKNSTSGVGLIEIYDLNPKASSKLVNISTRAAVGTGNNVVIAGFILGGDGGDSGIVVRGIGPSLTSVGVPDALADPTLELRDGNGELRAANNDWQDNPIQAAELMAAGLAPSNQLESAIALVLPPGLYTALLSGRNSGTGIGLVEVYDRGELK